MILYYLFHLRFALKKKILPHKSENSQWNSYLCLNKSYTNDETATLNLCLACRPPAGRLLYRPPDRTEANAFGIG